MAVKTKQESLPEFYFARLVFWLKLTGIDVLSKNENVPYRLLSACYMSFAVIYTVITCTEFKFRRDFNMISIIVIYVSAYVLTITKVIVIYRNRKAVGKLMMSFHKGFFKLDKRRGGEFEENCVRNMLGNIRFHMICYGMSIMMSFISGVTSSLSSRLTKSPENWILPFPPMSMIDITRSPNFEIMYICQVFAACLVCAWIYLTNYTVISIIAQTTTQLLILENCVRNYNSIKIETHLENGRKSFTDNLDYTLNYHLSILETVETVEYLCSYMVLCVFLSGLVMVCAAMYNAATVSLGSIEFCRYLFFFGMMAGEPFIYCWWGNELTLANEALAVAVSQAYDPNSPICYSKALNLMLVKSQKPLFFTAGKFVPLSVETFKGLLKASFSYFTVLRQVNSQ